EPHAEVIALAQAALTALVRCGARTATGGQCRRFVLRRLGLHRCSFHAGAVWAARGGGRPLAERLALSRQRCDRARGSPEALAARLNSSRMKSAWRRNPWTTGRTLVFERQHEDQFEETVAAHGIEVGRLSPATADASRWAYQRMVFDRGKE